MAGDFLAHGTGVPHYVVAIKHPAEMVRRLIFEPARLRVYASFPISSTRNQNDSRELVDEFRRRLHESFTVFDPLMIDERILKLELDENDAAESDQAKPSHLDIHLSNRWRPWLTGDFEPMALPYDKNYPLRIPTDQIREAIEDIDRQIEARDFRLIDSVQSVAAFRPNFRGHYARGVNTELLYASQAAGIPVHLSWDDKEDGTYGDSPFGVVGTRHSSLEELLSALNP
jgi:adenylate kinase